MDSNRHFEKIFWFASICVFLVILYIFACTFLPIPKENVRFADNALSFLMGAIISSVMGYFLAGNPSIKKIPETKPTDPQ